jgi:ABC-type transport system involved in multi-copper enzyme maturation permease subunit
MGLTPIQYGPWKGSRSDHGKRFLTIANQVFHEKMGSIWFIGILVLGTFLVHGLSLLFLSITPHLSLTAGMMLDQFEAVLFYIFALILVSMVCSDLIAEDLRANSLVLYLSRALRADDYLLGKALGALMVLAIFTLLMPLVLALAVLATQSGTDYLSSTVVVGETVLAGAWTMLFLLPVGLMLSSLTSRKTYAAVGTFMTFFLLEIMGGFFTRFDPSWQVLAPRTVLVGSYDILFGRTLPSAIDPVLLLLMAAVLTVPPLLIAYWRVYNKGVGK